MHKTCLALAIFTAFSAHAADGIWLEGTHQEGTDFENLAVGSQILSMAGQPKRQQVFC